MGGVVHQKGGYERKGNQQNRGSEDGERNAPAEAGDEALRENRHHDGAGADAHHRETQRESAMPVEPVRDHDAVGNGSGAAGKGDSQHRAEEIELPQAAAHPQCGDEGQAVEQGGGDDDAFRAKAIDEHAGGGKPECADDVDQRKSEGHGGAIGMEVRCQRLEKYAEGEDQERRAQEEADGRHENDEPSIEEPGPLADHGISGREAGVWPRTPIELAAATAVFARLYVGCVGSQDELIPCMRGVIQPMQREGRIQSAERAVPTH